MHRLPHLPGSAKIASAMYPPRVCCAPPPILLQVLLAASVMWWFVLSKQAKNNYIYTTGSASCCRRFSRAGSECGRKLPNRLPNFCLIDTKFCLISCLIACLIVRSSRYRNLGFLLIGDALRDHPATPEMGTFVPNGRRHGAMAAAGAPAKNASQIRQTIIFAHHGPTRVPLFLKLGPSLLIVP